MKFRLAAALIILSVPIAPGNGMAGTQAAPEVTDRRGDANFVNSNSQGGSEIGFSTEPATVDSADLRAIWLETSYDKRVETLDGTRWVRYDPTGLMININTTAPAKPTFGPSVLFWYPAELSTGCRLNFEAWVRGSNPAAVDREYAAVALLGSCPAGSIPSSGLSLMLSGQVLRVTFPFAAMAGVLADGVTVGPHAFLRPQVRVVQGAATAYVSTAPVIDEAARGGSFVIGSDVPADVNCSEQLSHPDCG